MDLFVHQVLAGLATGAIYACMALAVVMIYQAIDHFNFAQGEMAMFSTYIAWSLMHAGLPYWWAFILTLAISFLGGVLIERVIFKPIHDAPVLSHVVVFFALFSIFNSLAGYFWEFTIKVFPTPFPDWLRMGTFMGAHEVGMLAVTMLLLAGLYARGATEVREPRPTRDYTERMLAAFGWPVRFSPGRVELAGGHRLAATGVSVPADFSSAAFFLVAATLVPGSELLLPRVGINPRRTGLLHVLRAMGADIEQRGAGEQGGEPVADLVVRHAPLRGIEVPVEHVVDMIDEFPALFVAAACASGQTVVRGAAELRVKESDRIATMAAGLRQLGIRVDETPDGATIHGGQLLGGAVDSHGDHRVAMAFAVAGQLADGPVRIGDTANVATSFPGFAALARGLGFGLGSAD